MIDINEKYYLINLVDNIKHIRDYIYCILNLLSIKRKEYKENYHFYKYNLIPTKENNNTQINTNVINSKYKNLSDNIVNEVELMYSHLNDFIQLNDSGRTFNNNMIGNINETINIIKIRNKMNTLHIQIINRNDLVNLIIKNMIKKENMIIRNMVMTERYKINYYPPIKKNIPNISAHIEEWLKKNNNYKIKIQLTQKQILQTFQHVIIFIFPIFTIKIYLPTIGDESKNLNDYKYTISIFSDNMEYDNKFNYYNNYKNKSTNLFLYQKIRELFTNRIKSFIKIINEEKRRKIKSINNNEFLNEVLPRFMDYVKDYDKLFKIRCDICTYNLKYSIIEKCFYPPYYKLYINEDIISSKLKKKEKIPNLFVHEECYRKLGLPSL